MHPQRNKPGPKPGPRVALTCEHCGATFTVLPFWAARRRFCGVACKRAAQKGKPARPARTPRGPTPRPLAQRFWEKVDTSGECWLWTAASNRGGYGVISLGGGKDGRREAHRVSWELHYGTIPAGRWVLHRCDVPACVRPDHLFLGSHDENVRDMWAKGRGVTPTTPQRRTRAHETGATPVAPC